MEPAPQDQPPSFPALAWSCVALTGVLAPASAMLLASLGAFSASLASVGGPIITIALMGAGMIGGAIDGRFRVGVLLALLSGAVLVLLALVLEMLELRSHSATALAIFVASISFAARGALFARRASEKGWWIAAAVLAGEAAIVITAWAEPGILPSWLLALLPAQWANVAIQSSFIDGTSSAASSALIALVGTAAATMLVFWLWPRRWTYAVMFSTWLGLSALVYQNSGSHISHIDNATTVTHGSVESFRMAQQLRS